MYLDYAENQAEKGIPMTMNDWSEKLNAFLKFNDADILENAGKVTAEIAIHLKNSLKEYIILCLLNLVMKIKIRGMIGIMAKAGTFVKKASPPKTAEILR